MNENHDAPANCANLFSLAHIVAPEAVERLISFGHRRGRTVCGEGAE